MAQIERSALVMYSAEQMFDLVNDVASYPQFLPGCRGAEVLFHDGHTLEARLDLARAGLRHSFVTRNTLERPRGMTLELVEGPFAEFQGEWQFVPLAEDACRVEFRLFFSMRSRLIAAAAGKLFGDLANQMVDAMCARAGQVYGTEG